MPARLHGSSSLSVLMELRVAELAPIKAWSIPFRREGMGWTDEISFPQYDKLQ